MGQPRACFMPTRRPAPETKACASVNRRTTAPRRARENGCSTLPIMILPQVHLRKPCYDFYFLQAIEFERLLGQRCRGVNPRPRPIRGPH